MPALTAPKHIPSQPSEQIVGSGGAFQNEAAGSFVGSARRELVTVAIKKEDHARMKAAGGPHAAQIQMALKRYVDAVRKTGWSPRTTSFGWKRGEVVYVPMAITKDLADDIRMLPGRFDGHTIEAVHLLFQGNGSAKKESLQSQLQLTMSSRLVAGAAAVLSLIVGRILGQPSIS